jgi:hypothetical protein
MPAGRRYGGRKKGTPNKATADVRTAIAKVLQSNSRNFNRWLGQVAKGNKRRPPDPGRALQICMDMAEFHIPKLARTEITGAGGGPVIIRSTPTDEAL